jgi:ABC-type Fe3+-hydroxamate transport system substrate-binding protein
MNQRIISLVPSQSELLYDLGLADSIVGITKFCVHPAAKVKGTVKIGGTKNFNFDRIEALKPDLILGNKEENYQAGIERLAEKYKVWISDIVTLEDALEMIHIVGELTHTTQKAEILVQAIQHQFGILKDLTIQPFSNSITVVYFIWREPYMVAASGTFIDEMLKKCGFENVFSDLSRYPQISAEQLQVSNPQVILLSSEPYPFKAKHMAELQTICPDSLIRLVDGELFSWYGSRLLRSVDYFKELRQKLLSRL